MSKAEMLPKYISQIRESIDVYITKKIEGTGTSGLVASHGNILSSLYLKDKQPMCHIAEHIGKCRSTLTVLVDKLEKEGFITRNSDNEDTRVKQLCLTEKGKAFEREFWKISEDLQEILWKDFSDDEKKTLIHLIEKLNNNMKGIY